MWHDLWQFLVSPFPDYFDIKSGRSDTWGTAIVVAVLGIMGIIVVIRNAIVDYRYKESRKKQTHQ